MESWNGFALLADPEESPSTDSPETQPCRDRTDPDLSSLLPEPFFQDLCASNVDLRVSKGQEKLWPLEATSFSDGHSSAPIFFGYCYYCDCPQHSQNYCPLRMCHICDTYGHSGKVCVFNSAQQNPNWRRRPPALGRSHPRTCSARGSSSGLKIPFGSTWKRSVSDSTSDNWRPPVLHRPPPTLCSDDVNFIPCGILMDLLA